MKRTSDIELLKQVLEIYDRRVVCRQLTLTGVDAWSLARLTKAKKRPDSLSFDPAERQALQELLPKKPRRKYDFDFVDLFAGIGGLRRAFESIGGRCVLTSEWNKYALRTYKANYYSPPDAHSFIGDIRSVTLSEEPSATSAQVQKRIEEAIPDHDVLLAGFPCQPFSIAGVSKKNALGRHHGFECKIQGTLFFDVARILSVKRPAAFLLENVKNLKSHDEGRTFKVILETLNELGYWVADLIHLAGKDPKVIDARHFLPQHRERTVLVGFRRDLGIHEGFSLKEVAQYHPKQVPSLGSLLESRVDSKYILTPKVWEFLVEYAMKHKERGNGFGFGLVSKNASATRTLSARYYKDGSEILVDRGFNPRKSVRDQQNIARRPRRLTPRECARLMGFDQPDTSRFRIPVSDTQAYKQFGNSVAVPVFTAVAKLMKPRIIAAKAKAQNVRRKPGLASGR